MIHFLIEEWPVMESESFITIISYRFHDLIIVKDFNSFQSQKWQQQNIMLTICWSAITIIHDSYLVINQRITTKVYCQQMEEMYIYLSKIRRGPILFSACCQDDTAEGHLIWIRDFDTSTICHWSLTHWIPLFQASWQVLRQKTFRCNDDRENAFQDFLSFKPLEFRF